METENPLRSICTVLSGLSIMAGGIGMVMSFGYLASASMADITAGTSGFIAGAVLIGSGLLSLALLVTVAQIHGKQVQTGGNRHANGTRVK